MLQRLQEEFGPRICNSYVISMSHTASDLLEVLLLAKEAGSRGSRPTNAASLLVVPLFETVEDLQRAPEVMEGCSRRRSTANSCRCGAAKAAAAGTDAGLLRQQQGFRLPLQQLGDSSKPRSPFRNSPAARTWRFASSTAAVDPSVVAAGRPIRRSWPNPAAHCRAGSKSPNRVKCWPRSTACPSWRSTTWRPSPRPWCRTAW